MPTVDHNPEVETTVDAVRQWGAPFEEEPGELVEVYQGKCECGWVGPRRMRQWEAKDDAAYHKANPEIDNV